MFRIDFGRLSWRLFRPMGKLTDYVVFLDSKLSQKFEHDKIPIDTLWEAYFDGAIDIPGDIYRLLEDRHAVAKHPFTKEHVKYFVTKFVPELVVHSRQIDEKLVRWHYDRGDDFFAAFLGPRMVYTSGFFTNTDQSVEQAQDQKLDLVCQKLMLNPGERFLDIGCGWGTLAMHAAKHYGVTSTGVTLSENQAKFATERAQANGLSDKVKFLCMDYRQIPKGRYDKIANLEMVEHVGIKNLKPFYEQVYDLLEDQGLFLMQWTGLRRRSAQEDLVWGLFMAKYVFAGADASLPLAPMMGYMEKANWEIHSVENISYHYCVTIKKWHDNWLTHREQIVRAYGERWYRIWHVFLAWATTIAAQGTAACFQVIAHKNLNQFDRSRWVGRASLGEQGRIVVPGRRPDWRDPGTGDRESPPAIQPSLSH
jgi:cyclopropane fatty-acyl-phospholipid synthase-like methyltransferase